MSTEDLGRVTVLDYDPAWVDRFEALRSEYEAALAAAGIPLVAIEHVGSTAVPGLAAKPIIDIDIVVEESAVEGASDVLVRLGFVPRGELGIPLRWAFWEPQRLSGTNTYVVVDGSLSLRNHLAVRDALRNSEALRRKYGEAKKRAAASAADIYEYGRRKNNTVQEILAVAGLTPAERDSINSNQVLTAQVVPRPQASS